MSPSVGNTYITTIRVEIYLRSALVGQERFLLELGLQTTSLQPCLVGPSRLLASQMPMKARSFLLSPICGLRLPVRLVRPSLAVKNLVLKVFGGEGAEQALEAGVEDTVGADLSFLLMSQTRKDDSEERNDEVDAGKTKAEEQQRAAEPEHQRHPRR